MIINRVDFVAAIEGRDVSCATDFEGDERQISLTVVQACCSIFQTVKRCGFGVLSPLIRGSGRQEQGGNRP